MNIQMNINMDIFSARKHTISFCFFKAFNVVRKICRVLRPITPHLSNSTVHDIFAGPAALPLNDILKVENNAF
jgi:hypothetical protein